MNKAYKILMVDDEPDVLEFLQYTFLKAGYLVETAQNGLEAVEKTERFVPDVILMDVMMPKMDGIEAARQIRKKGFHTIQLLFLTARIDEQSEVKAFEAGANDYIHKPIKPQALLMRINNLLKREKGEEDRKNSNILEVLDLIINKFDYSVQKPSGERVVLPRKEFEVLFYLAKLPNKVCSRDDLLNKIWGADVFVVDRTVDVHIRKIREKIGEHYIKTLKGVGYMFSTDGNS